jgi:cellulose synthase/poly-beta-1,6-N-acetylglucosamine synthase-like glycosyltransferase
MSGESPMTSVAGADAGGASGGGIVAGRVAAIVIGRNEGERLVRCLRSVLASISDVVYVDSNSSDGSVARAREMGVHVVAITRGPFTAARGRQEGIEAVRAMFPQAVYMFFIDGDCILDPAWTGEATRYLDEHPRAAGVFGRRRELHAGKNVYSTMVDLEWEMPEGPTICHGGDALDRLSALDEVGGWSTDLIAGEDPDLGFRLRARGWEIHCVRREMTLHDVAMTRVGQYLKRARRSGHAYAEVGWRQRRGPGRVFLKRTASILLYGLMLPIVSIALAILYWPGLIVPALLYARVLVHLFLYARRGGCGAGVAAYYAVLTIVCKSAGALGVLRFGAGLLTGRRSRIIEYKGPAARAGG